MVTLDELTRSTKRMMQLPAYLRPVRFSTNRHTQLFIVFPVWFVWDKFVVGPVTKTLHTSSTSEKPLRERPHPLVMHDTANQRDTNFEREAETMTAAGKQSSRGRQ